jgi:hypothetical protein
MVVRRRYWNLSIALSRFIAAVVLFVLPATCRAGLYYSGEPIADLPSQWRGFLLDQRALRMVAVNPTGAMQPSPMRQRYRDDATRLVKAAQERKLTADELADLGALHIRLGEVSKAVDVLRPAQREHPNHFRIAANLGTAWQLQGDLAQAAACLEQAVRLAPGKYQGAEELHLKLVRLRQRQPNDAQDLDGLFGIRYVGESGSFEPGKLAAGQRKKLPADAAASVQMLALWLPADGRLLWQLAELANAHGDVRTAAAIFDGCVTEFGLGHPELRRRRQQARSAADEIAKQVSSSEDAKVMHEEHAAAFKARSKRPLLAKLDLAALPPVRADGVNFLPWVVLNETAIDKNFRPTFPKYLRDLEGKQVAMTGFIQPFDDAVDVTSFMLIEYPIGCWFCEMPELTGIAYVELPENKSAKFSRSLVKITGTLSLNSTDPENFLYIINKAQVSPAD